MNKHVLAYSDFFVRYLLADENNKDLLLSFINAVNEDYGFPFIDSIEIKNPFNLKQYKLDKESVIDVRAVDGNGKQYDIEVQISGNETFKHRSLYYWSKLYNSQIGEGDNYQKLNPTICINLINFKIIENYKNVHSCFLIKEKNNPELILTDHLMIHFIELPKFIKPKEYQNQFEKWLTFFKYEGSEDDIMETIIKDDPIINKAHKRYDNFTKNDQLMEVYEGKVKYQQIYKTDITYAMEKGIEKGIEKVAKAMIANNEPVDKICEFTGLSVEQIRGLK